MSYPHDASIYTLESASCKVTVIPALPSNVLPSSIVAKLPTSVEHGSSNCSASKLISHSVLS